jgi:hypothetical protein
MVFEKLTGMRCPKNATALLHVFGRTDGINELTWATPDGRKKTLHFAAYPAKVGMDTVKSATHLNTLWEMLDTEVESIKKSADEFNKYRARAFAEVLCILMQPFYENPDAVAREALARYKARTEGSEHETPGLGEAIWDPYTRWDGTVIEQKKSSPSSKPVNNKPFPPEAIPGAKQALDLKMMTLSQLAKMYDVSEDTVRSAVGA